MPVATCQNIAIALGVSGSETIDPALVNNNSYDNCNLNFVVTPSTVNCSDIGNVQVTLAAADPAGNASTCNATVTVSDALNPVAQCKDVTIHIDGSGNASLTSADIDDNSTDNCGIETYSLSQPAFDCSHLGNNAVQLTVTDSSGNAHSCTANVAVADTTPPDAQCVGVHVGALGPGGNVSITTSDINNGSSDNCGSVALSLSQSTFTCADVGTVDVTLTAMDNDGNTDTCTSQIVIQDNQIPVAMCQNINIPLDINGEANINGSQIAAGSSDNCTPLSFVANPSFFDCDDIGNHTVTVEVSDQSGNSGTCTAVVNIIDNMPPVAVCQNLPVFIGNNGFAPVTANQVNNGSNDNCGAVTLELQPSVFDCDDIGVQNAILSVTDMQNNTSTCSAAIMVSDTSAPSVMCKDITLGLVNGLAVLTPGLIDDNSTDNCIISQLTADPDTFTAANLGPNNVVLTAVDPSGNIDTCIAVVTIDSTVMGPIARCKDITKVLNNMGEVMVFPAEVDDGSTGTGPLIFNLSPDMFTCDDVGPNTAILSVTDNEGTTTCSATITIEDNIQPTVVCKSTHSIILNSMGEAPVPIGALLIDVADNCDYTLAVSPDMVFCDDVGTITATVTATDDGGNQATCNTQVTVIDNITPLALCKNASVFIGPSGIGQLQPEQVNNNSIDNCDLILSVVPNQFTCSQTGGHTVTLTVIDPAGASSNCNAFVSVADTTPPEMHCKDDTLHLGGGGTTILNPSDIDNGSSDNCNVGLSVSPQIFDCDDIGMHQVVLTGSDLSQNTGNCAANLLVVDDMDPNAVCQNITLELNMSGMATLDPTQVDGGSTDNCGIASLSVFPNTFTAANLGPNNVVLTVVDVNGNSAICNAIVTILEFGTAADAQCKDNTVYMGQSGIYSIDPAIIDDGSTGAAPLTLSVSPSTIDCNNLGPNMVILSATDGLGNVDTCHATLTVLDTIRPHAQCKDYTLPLGISVPTILPATEVNDNSNDNCFISALVVDPAEFDCNNIGTTQVDLYVTDNSGNTSSCTANVTTVDNFPPVLTCKDVTLEVNMGGQLFLNPASVVDVLADNCPGTDLKSNPAFFNCASIGDHNVLITATDISGNTSTCIGIVTVIDKQPPPITCNDITVELNASGQRIVDPQEIVGIIPPSPCGQVQLSMSQSTFDCGDIGDNLVTVTLSGSLGVINTCTATVTVEDNSAPTAFCKDITFNLVGPGQNILNPVLVDNGSTDNCSIFDRTVAPNTFNCNDVGEHIVLLTVFDESGNSDQCTSIVTIAGGGAINAVCKNTPIDLDLFGIACLEPEDVDGGSSAGCGSVSLSVSPNKFNCNDIGQNIVQLLVTGDGGNTATCTAVVSVEDNMPPILICYDVTLELNQFGNAILDPLQSIDLVNSYDNCGTINILGAIPSTFTCANLGLNSVAIEVNDGNGNDESCAINVTVEASDSSVNMVLDMSSTPESAPGANDGHAMVVVSGGSGIYTYNWDDPDNSQSSSANFLPAGEYCVTVTDLQTNCMAVGCVTVGLQTDLTFSAGMVSGQAGTTVSIPIRVNNFDDVVSFQFSIHVDDLLVADVQNVIPQISNVTVNTTGNDIQVSWDDPTGNGVSFPDDFEILRIDVLLVGNPGEMTNVTFDDNPLPIEAEQISGGNVTPVSPQTINGKVTIEAGVEYMLAGDIRTEIGLPVQLANVTLSGTSSGTQVTNATGMYSFTVPEGSNSTITPTKDINYTNGVTTFDLVLISQHILQLIPLNSPYKIIGADANGDNAVTTLDIVEFRKLILQLIPSLPFVDSWRFVPEDHIFPNPSNPFTTPLFPENIFYPNVTQDELDGDFVGIKVGDMDNSVNPAMFTGDNDPESRGASTLLLHTPHQDLQAGERIEVPITAGELNRILGYQFTLDYNTDAMTFVGVQSGILPNVNEDFFIEKTPGQIATNWYASQPANLAPGDVLFTLLFEVQQNTISLEGNLDITSNLLQKEAYDDHYAHMDVALRFEDMSNTITQNQNFVLLGNRPNPFTNNTSILFTLPQTSDVLVKVYNSAGQEVHRLSAQFDKGTHSVNMSSDALQGPGVYYYQMQTDSGNGEGKLVLVE